MQWSGSPKNRRIIHTKDGKKSEYIPNKSRAQNATTKFLNCLKCINQSFNKQSPETIKQQIENWFNFAPSKIDIQQIDPHVIDHPLPSPVSSNLLSPPSQSFTDPQHIELYGIDHQLSLVSPISLSLASTPLQPTSIPQFNSIPVPVEWEKVSLGKKCYLIDLFWSDCP